jgi:hypothetical protein
MQPERIPYGFCQCGCGERTTLADWTSPRLGYVNGEPRRFRRGHNGRKRERYRVEDRGYKTPCWIWLLAKDEKGYGRMNVQGESPQAHRSYYEAAHGPIPEGLHLDHLCTQPDCVNPSHLEAVTLAENVRRGRLAKLTMDKAREIRRLAADGASQRVLAERFEVSQTTIWLTLLGRRWQES